MDRKESRPFAETKSGERKAAMPFRKIISQPIVVDEAGLRLVGAVNAVVVATMKDARRSTTRLSSHQRVRIVQRGGKTEVFEHESRVEEGGLDDDV